MKIKLINYNRTISHVGMSKVLIDEVKVLKSEDENGPDKLEILFGNETGSIRRVFDIKEDIAFIVSMVRASGIEIADDFALESDSLMGKVLYIQLAIDEGMEPEIYAFEKLSKESAASKEDLDKILSYNPNPFEDDDMPF